MTESTELILTGAEMALLVAAVGLLADRPFEVEAARLMATPRARADAEFLGVRLFSHWKQILEDADLWDVGSGQWSRDLIEKRSRLNLSVSFQDTEVSLAKLGLDCAFAEFRNNWGEFCVVGTGALHWYPVGPPELEKLSTRFEKSSGG